MTDHQKLWIGGRVRQYRRSRGLTQQLLATEIEARGPVTVDQSTVSNWERGRAEISLRYRRPLADALGVPVDILFEDPPAGWQPTRTAA